MLLDPLLEKQNLILLPQKRIWTLRGPLQHPWHFPPNSSLGYHAILHPDFLEKPVDEPGKTVLKI